MRAALFFRGGYRVFLKTINPGRRVNFRALYFLFLFAALAIVLVFFINLFSIGRGSFGEWGDFFGGVLNPILTFLTFMGLLITIVIQQTELKESRQELKRSADALSIQVLNMEKQNFEATFFKMLSTHNGIVSSMNAELKKRKYSGRDSFILFFNALADSYDSYHDDDRGELLCLKEAYKEFWMLYQLDLGHYFRFLYNILRFIKESGYSEGLYIRLVRAQLSNQELLIIFYNCIVSEDGGRFKTLAEEFALFDNMPRDGVLHPSHLGFISDSAF